ncbi:hypothetical protein ACYE2N_14120 [Flavobacterium sp. MAHUQ-51]|uniref:hypothetical protein n=1 Tax=Flavobacterium sp. GCM10022190 TaxID=3252639 RepID=UPI00360A20B6
MNILNYVFYRMYKSTARVNNLYPEVAVVIFLSAMFFLNIASILLLMDASIENIGLNGIYLIVTVILAFNLFYFLKNDKYKIIIEEFESVKNKIFIDILIFVYPFLSIYLCFSLLEMSNTQIGFTLGGLLLVEIYAYFDQK